MKFPKNPLNRYLLKTATFAIRSIYHGIQSLGLDFELLKIFLATSKNDTLLFRNHML